MNTARRRFLSCLPALGAVGIPAAAFAFRQEVAAPEVAAEYADYAGQACSEAQVHESLRRELEKVLAEDGSTPNPRSLARCPFCGCAGPELFDKGKRFKADHSGAERAR